jgi:hypothetical protein
MANDAPGYRLGRVLHDIDSVSIEREQVIDRVPASPPAKPAMHQYELCNRCASASATVRLISVQLKADDQASPC